MNDPGNRPSRPERGVTVAEVMVALVVLGVGILAVSQLFPAASKSQLQSRMTSAANYLAQEQVEQLTALDFASPALSPGRHPASGSDAVGDGGRWERFYQVTAMTSPLNHLKQVTVTVQWAGGSRSVSTTTYVRR
jgi:prepilin-type N-terminal cleavage/methylation domain-containing protein